MTKQKKKKCSQETACADIGTGVRMLCDVCVRVFVPECACVTCVYTDVVSRLSFVLATNCLVRNGFSHAAEAEIAEIAVGRSAAAAAAVRGDRRPAGCCCAVVA